MSEGRMHVWPEFPDDVVCGPYPTPRPFQGLGPGHRIIWPDCITSRSVRTTGEDKESRPSAVGVQRLSNARARIPIRSTRILFPEEPPHIEKCQRAVSEIA